MTDDLDIHAQVFREEAPIVPRPAARDSAIAQASARFAQENSKHAQGSSPLARLTHRVGQFFERRRFMSTIRINHIAMGGASLAALALVIAVMAPLTQQKLDTIGEATPESKVALGKKEVADDKRRQDETVVAQVPATDAAAPLERERLLTEEDAAGIAAAPVAKGKATFLANRQVAAPLPSTMADQQYHGCTVQQGTRRRSAICR